MAIETFMDNDEGYLRWIRNNPHGYVLNGYRQLSPDYIIIHSASKNCVKKLQSGARYWTKDYIKVCSNNLAELEAWTRQRVHGEPKRCGNCRPS